MYQKMRRHFSVLTPRAQKTLISASFHNSLQFFFIQINKKLNKLKLNML